MTSKEPKMQNPNQISTENQKPVSMPDPPPVRRNRTVCLTPEAEALMTGVGDRNVSAYLSRLVESRYSQWNTAVAILRALRGDGACVDYDGITITLRPHSQKPLLDSAHRAVRTLQAEIAAGNAECIEAVKELARG